MQIDAERWRRLVAEEVDARSDLRDLSSRWGAHRLMPWLSDFYLVWHINAVVKLAKVKIDIGPRSRFTPGC